jgi:DNA-binding CsgD family transcriptional regulator
MDRLFTTAVDEIYNAALDPARWSQALHAISECFGDVGAILIYGRDDGSFGVIESPALAPLMPEYRQEWSRRDIRAFRARERGYFLGRDIITDRDILTPQEMETDPFYADFLARYDLKYFAAAIVSPDPHVEVALSVQRLRDKPEFSDEEIERLGRIGPHIEKALRLSIRLMDAELINMGLGAALARIGIGVFALDSLGRVVFSNPGAQAMLGDGLSIANDRLRIGDAAAQTDALAAIEQVLVDRPERTLDPKPILLQRQRSRRPLALYVMPIPMQASTANKFLTHARAIVLVIDPESSAPPDPSLIRDVLGLTLGEARIAALVGVGTAPRDAAAKLGISEDTVRTVLKRVFAKAGVSRQSELAALMAKLVLR